MVFAAHSSSTIPRPLFSIGNFACPSTVSEDSLYMAKTSRSSSSVYNLFSVKSIILSRYPNFLYRGQGCIPIRTPTHSVVKAGVYVYGSILINFFIISRRESCYTGPSTLLHPLPRHSLINCCSSLLTPPGLHIISFITDCSFSFVRCAVHAGQWSSTVVENKY